METNLNKVYSKPPGKKRNFKSSKIALSQLTEVEAGIDKQKAIIEDLYNKIDRATAINKELIDMENTMFDNVQDYQDARKETANVLDVIYDNLDEIAGYIVADDTLGKYYDMIVELEQEFLGRVKEARDSGLRF